MDLLEFDFMRHALLAALLVGATAPLVGVFIVQRRMALVGDGLGHVALAGVALGVLTQSNPVWVALVVAVAAGLIIELLRSVGKAESDVVMALLFYGGIAGGVVLMSKAPPSSSTNLIAYLFGSILTTQTSDLIAFGVLSVTVLLAVALLGQRLFSVGNDEEFARAMGMPVLPLNLILSAITAATVVLSMRVIGLLLISALLVLPVAIAQQYATSFRLTVIFSILIGAVMSVGGTTMSYFTDTPAGGTIVLAGIALFICSTIVRGLLHKTRSHQSALAAHK